MSSLETIFREDSQRMNTVIEEFTNSFIIEFIGATKEYLRLNDTIRDYIQRMWIKMDNKYKRNLENHVENTFNDYDAFDSDISDYLITIKEALKKGYDIPQELLLPSHFLNAMRELYTYERRYDYVITLADRVLLQEKYLDERIVREVRQRLCLSLARKRDMRMLNEVRYFKGPDRNFLLGFYYRLVGRHEDAIKRFTSVLEDSPGFYRAKRELVQVYLNLEEYDMAFELAKENYKLLKNNPYNLQSYFRCLVRNSNISPKEKKEELIKLLENLKNNPNERAKEMYKTEKSQFYAIIENDQSRALNTVDDAIATFPKSIYPPLTRIEICRKFDNWQELENSINSIDTAFRPDSDIFSKLSYISAKAIVMARKGDVKESQRLIFNKIKPRFTESVYNKLKEEIDSVQ